VANSSFHNSTEHLELVVFFLGFPLFSLYHRSSKDVHRKLFLLEELFLMLNDQDTSDRNNTNRDTSG